MNGDEKDKRLFSLMAVRRGEAFWAGRRAAIISAVAEKGQARRVVLPALGLAAALLLVLLAPWRRPEPEQPAVSAAFLENIDMLDDMDVLEALPEELL